MTSLRGVTLAALLGIAATGCVRAPAEEEEVCETDDGREVPCEEEEEESLGDWILRTTLEAALDWVFSGDGDDGDDGDHGDAPPPWRRGRSWLRRPAGEPDADARGFVETARRGRRERFLVAVEGLDGGAATLHLELSPGLFSLAGAIEAAPGGPAVLHRDTRSGEPLPGGAADLRALEGRRLEVRGPSGTVLLRGRVPAPRRAPARTRTRRFADPEGGVRAVVRLRRSAGGREVLSLRLRGLEPHAPLDLLLDPAEGGPVRVASGVADARGGWILLRDGRLGDPLPLDADGIASLGGLGFSVEAGVPLLEGAIPVL
jgi:hypothetical protein